MATNNEEEKRTDNLTIDDIIADLESKNAGDASAEKDAVSPDEEENGAISAKDISDDNGDEPDIANTDEDGGKTDKKEKKPNFFIRLIKGIIPWKGDTVGLVIRKLVFIAALIVFLATAIPLLADVLSMVKDEQVSKQLSQLYLDTEDDSEVSENSKEILPSFKKLLEINPDTVGYLKIDGTIIDYPVVKTDDNDFYLTHDFYKNESRSGTVMMDYHNEVTPDGHSANMILYGHNMQVGTFFATLGEYWRTMYDQYPEGTKSFYKEHPVIRFDTLYERAEWKVFAFGIYNVAESRGEVFGYNLKYDFTSEDDFNDYIINIMDRSDIFTDVDLKYGDDILTLSTCYWPYENSGNTVRLAIFARKLRDGESSNVNVDNVQVNTYVKRWQWVYDQISGGYDWAQSNWDRRKLLSYDADDAERDNYTFPSASD
ncbi:MAG: class B sortase [Ruminiclostridium sp.]